MKTLFNILMSKSCIILLLEGKKLYQCFKGVFN